MRAGQRAKLTRMSLWVLDIPISSSRILTSTVPLVAPGRRSTSLPYVKIRLSEPHSQGYAFIRKTQHIPNEILSYILCNDTRL
jgi:hypothetical protein